MLELDNIKINLNNDLKDLEEIKKSLDISSKKDRIKEIEMQMQDASFWNDVNNANAVNKEMKILNDSLLKYEKLEKDYNDIIDLINLAEEEDDKSLVKEIINSYDNLNKEINDYKMILLFSGEYDNLDCIMHMSAGSGGTESCDFCEMLNRMYLRFFQKKGFDTKVIDFLDGDEAGIKSITYKISGENAYGYFKSESGVHRLVRISPFNAQNKRQTSFLSVDVIPDIKDDINIDIRDEDLKIDFFRASGAGGQHINKTSSAVRITHIPTGIVVQSQEERYQAINKENCMKMLKTKLLMIEQNKMKDKISNIRGDIKDNSFGSQIRNYILQPYKLVKDLRTGEETTDADSVLDGNIESFIMAYLRWIKLGCPDRKVMNDE